MGRIQMVIDGVEAGGGLLRAALPLGVAQHTPFEVVNFRAGRLEPGLGWPQLAVLEALVASGVIAVEGAAMGSTSFSIQPTESIAPGTHIDVNLDDPEHTFQSDGIWVVRDYPMVEEAFPDQKLINQDGRGVRGHAVSTPLLALLPLTLSGVTLSLSGGTETPGAPFVDGLSAGHVRVLNSLFNTQVTIDAQSRGVFGLGGGHVSASNGSGPLAYDQEKPGFVTYWSAEMADSTMPRALAARENIDAVRRLLPDVVLYNEPYEDGVPSINQLLLVPPTAEGFPRDINICAEEAIDQISGNAFLARIRSELNDRDRNLVSRFHIEQVILWAAMRGQDGTWRTERITPHIRAVIALVQTMTDAEIRVDESAGHTEIRMG